MALITMEFVPARTMQTVRLPLLLALAIMSGIGSVSAQTTPHPEGARSGVSGEFRVFRGDGTAASLADIIDAMGAHEVVFVGETHDDPVGHELEQALFTGAFSRWGSGTDAPRAVALSLEMFERDVQYILDEYLDGWITEDHFLKSARPWEFYESDYRPMVEFAKRHEAPVIAANSPRRYANRVTREGPESLMELGAEALRTLPPLPFPEPSAAYRAQWEEAMTESIPDSESEDEALPEAGDTEAGDTATANPHEPAPTHPGMDPAFMERALYSQSLWDAGMAYSITEHLLESPNALVLHMVGSFHVAGGTGTPEQLAYYLPGTKAMVVVIRAVEDISAFDPERDGENEDFVILTEESQTRSAAEGS